MVIFTQKTRIIDWPTLSCLHLFFKILHQPWAWHGNDNALSHDPINEAIDDGNFNFEIQDLRRKNLLKFGMVWEQGVFNSPHYKL
jgi:hypothetical protein